MNASTSPNGRLSTTLLFRYDLRSSRPAPSGRNDLRIENLDAVDVDRLSEVNADVERSIESAKLDSGSRCYVGYLAGRLAHYTWVQDRGVHAMAGTGRSRRVGAGSFWIYACFTAHWARGRGVYADVLRWVLADRKSRGFHTAWIYVADWNVASRNGIARVGFELVSRYRALSIRGRTLPLP
jgi:hypothetical protein